MSDAPILRLNPALDPAAFAAAYAREGVARIPDVFEPAVVDRLAAAMAEVSKDPAFIAKTTSLGIVPTARGPKEFAAFIAGEVTTNTALLKDSGFKPE